MDIQTHIHQGVLTITFNRPAKKNAITRAMYQSMVDALTSAEHDPAVRAIIITGAPTIFTAGNDLEDFMQHAAELATNANAPVFQFMHALSQSSKPVIAAVAGAAVGIGTTLLLHCDLVYLADNALLCMPFTQLALCPEFASSLLLPQRVGHQRAAEKLLLGEAFNAQEAYDMGLANKVLPADDLLTYANAQADKLVSLPANTLRTTKRLLKIEQKAAITDRIKEENIQFATMLAAPEAKEALLAFFQKRKPDFGYFN